MNLTIVLGFGCILAIILVNAWARCTKEQFQSFLGAFGIGGIMYLILLAGRVN